MIIPEKYAVLRDRENYRTINQLLNKKYGTTFSYDQHYLNVNTKHPGSRENSIEKHSYVRDGYTLVSYEQFVAIFEEEEKERLRKEQKAVEDRIKNEIKGLYRERLKTLEDTIVELRYENQQLKQQLAKTSPVSC